MNQSGDDIITLNIRFHKYQSFNIAPESQNKICLRDGASSHCMPTSVKRKFRMSEAIYSLLTYIDSHPSCPREYHVYALFPKRKVESKDGACTIREWGFVGNTVIDVEIIS